MELMNEAQARMRVRERLGFSPGTPRVNCEVAEAYCINPENALPGIMSSLAPWCIAVNIEFGVQIVCDLLRCAAEDFQVILEKMLGPLLAESDKDLPPMSAEHRYLALIVTTLGMLRQGQRTIEIGVLDPKATIQFVDSQILAVTLGEPAWFQSVKLSVPRHHDDIRQMIEKETVRYAISNNPVRPTGRPVSLVQAIVAKLKGTVVSWPVGIAIMEGMAKASFDTSHRVSRLISQAPLVNAVFRGSDGRMYHVTHFSPELALEHLQSTYHGTDRTFEYVNAVSAVPWAIWVE